MAKLSASGSQLVYSTYLGGHDTVFYGTAATCIAVDSAGRAVVGGYTPATDFPLVKPYQSAQPGAYSSSVTRFSPSGTGLDYSTYLGGSESDDIFAIAIDPSGQIIVAGTLYSADLTLVNSQGSQLDGGIARTADGGTTWETLNSGLTSHTVNRLAFTSDAMYAATSIGGVFKSTDNGANWSLSGFKNKNVTGLLADPSAGTLYAGTEFDGMFKSGDGGSTWQSIGLTDAYISNVYFDPVSSSTLYAISSNKGVQRSVDGGKSWSTINNGLPGTTPFDVAIVPSSPNTLYVGTVSGLYKSTDGGSIWTKKSNGITYALVYSVAIDPSNPQHLFAGTSTGIYYSADGAENWQQLSLNTSLWVQCLVFDPASATTLYAGTGNGLFVSRDSGITWRELGRRDLPSLNISSLAFGTAGKSSLYIATSSTSEGFVAKLNPNDSTAAFIRAVGGNSTDSIAGLALDSAGAIYITGGTSSENLALRDPIQATLGGSSDAFVMKLDSDGTVSFATYLGGTSSDSGSGIAVGSGGTVYIAGTTQSSKFPVLAAGSAYLSDYHAGKDAFIARLDPSYSIYCAHVASTADWWTRIAVVNAGTSSTPVVIQAFSSTGQLLETKSDVTLAPQGALNADIADLLSSDTLVQSPWLKITGQTPLKGVLEFGMRDNQNVTAMPMFSLSASDLVFPYVASVQGFYTGITLINPWSDPAAVRLYAYDKDGKQLGSTSLTIGANSKYVNLAHLIFNPATVDPAKVLSIQVSTDRPLMGFELFGTEQGDGLAGLPVSSQTVLLAGKAPLPAKPIYLCELPDPNIYATGATVSNLGAASTSVRAELYNASGAVIRSADFSDVQPRAQLTRMVNQFYGDSQIPAGAAYMKLSAPDKLMGFELYWSMDGPFQFDGILGIEAGSTRHFFPLTRAGDSWASYLRVTDLSGSTNALTVTAYSSAGSVVGTYTGNLPGNGQLKAATTAMFAGKENQIAWIYVSTQGEALANYVYVSSDGARMGSYTALPADK